MSEIQKPGAVVDHSAQIIAGMSDAPVEELVAKAIQTFLNDVILRMTNTSRRWGNALEPEYCGGYIQQVVDFVRPVLDRAGIEVADIFASAMPQAKELSDELTVEEVLGKYDNRPIPYPVEQMIERLAKRKARADVDKLLVEIDGIVRDM